MKNKTQLFATLFGALFMLISVACTPTVDNGGAEIEPAAPGEEPSISKPDIVESQIVDGLIGIDWDLILMGNEDVTGKGITINFTGDGVSGSDGCNSYGNSYKIEGNSLAFSGPFMSTQMACADMETPAKYLEALSTVGELVVDDSRLTIQTEQGELVFIPAQSAELENTKWMLTGLNSGDAIVSMAIDQAVFFLIEGNVVSGDGGCNTFGGGAEIAGDQISFKELFSTEMFCEGDGVSARENQFFDALNRVASYEISRQQLTLLDINGELIATFQVAGEDNGMEEGMSIDNAGSVEGQTWALVHMIVGGDAVVPAPQGTNITFAINSGSISGNSGCNMFNGSITIEDDSMSMGPLITTRRACVEEVMNFESAILAQLAQVGAYSVVGNTLLLSTADGLPLAEFALAETKTVFIGSEQVDCEGVAPQKCFLMKEDPNADYTYFYDTIGGFEWEAGFEYELLVHVTEVKEPLADASSLTYKLVQIVSKTAVIE